jgi:hypothetical protein
MSDTGKGLSASSQLTQKVVLLPKDFESITNRKTDILSVFDDKNMEYEYNPDKQLCIVKMNHTNCVELYFDDDAHKIIVKSIYKCSSDNSTVGSGKYILLKLIELSKQPKYESYQLIIEYDVSRIVPPEIVMKKANLSLSKLRILSSGKTWYNSMGFYEDCYAYTKDCIHNFIDNTQISISYSNKPTDIRTRVLAHRPELLLEIPKKGMVKDVFTSIASDITKISRTWEKIIRDGGNIDTEIIPEEKQLLQKYSKLLDYHYKKLEDLCNDCKKDDNSKCYLNKKNNDLIYSDVEPTKAPKSSASEACFGLSSSVRSAPCPNSSGDLRSPSELVVQRLSAPLPMSLTVGGGTSRGRRKKKYNKTRKVHFA